MAARRLNPLVLDYSPRPPGPANPFLGPMRGWRTTCGWCLGGTVAGFLFFPPVGIVAGVATAGAAAVTIVYLGRAARAEVDAGYAARQVVLAVLLSGLCLLGVWAVPLLVESDLAKWRLAEGRDRRRSAGER